MTNPVAHFITVDCDFCGEVVESAETCPVCGKVMCYSCVELSDEIKQCGRCGRIVCKEHIIKKNGFCNCG